MSSMIVQGLLPEFDQEMANTRKTLERVPEDKFGWKPHEKSMAMDRLSGHIAQMVGWTIPTINLDEMDFMPEGGPAFQPLIPTSRKQLLDEFDKFVAEARAAIAGASDLHLLKGWTLKGAGKTIFTMPRIAVIRTFVMNHIIHHRAQLGVYLRLNDVPVPSLYGPSADEGAPN
ncbi:MAG: DinB family protein [Bryobacteraceae bacterium]|jgi:uncharacterized damage-inducible protein DinB